MMAIVSQALDMGLEQQRMTPAFLIAAAINLSGSIDLPLVHDGQAEIYARVAFSLGREGEMIQQRYWISPPQPDHLPMILRRGEREPLDMLLLAACLTYVFRERTPSLFRLAESGGRGLPPRLCLPGEQNDHARRRLLHDAFNIYLLAYEEHLV